MDQAYEVVRMIDLGLYVLVLWGFWRHRETFFTARRQLRMLLVGFGLLVGYGLYSTVELLMFDVPGGSRTLIAPVPLLFIALSLHLDLLRRLWHKVRTYTRHDLRRPT